MLPRSDTMQRYRQFAQDPLSILKAGAQRQMYDEYKQQLQQTTADTAAQDEEMTEDLDWENFVVVEKIDIYDDAEMREMEIAADTEKARLA